MSKPDDEQRMGMGMVAAAAPTASDHGGIGRHTVEATPCDAGARLDRLLAERIEGVSRARLQALIRAGHVCDRSGRTVVDPGLRVKPADVFSLEIPAPEPAAPAAEAIPLDVVFEDAHVIVVDKPAGLVVHPAAGHAGGTLVNALIGHCGDSLSGIGGIRRPGIVHRLDKDTSGLLVVAKSDAAHQALAAQFAAHGADGRLLREYRAIVWGVPARARGAIDAALARSATHRTRIAVVREQSGRRAVTHYEVLKSWTGANGKPLASLLACRLETGRTHQIRVHLAHIGHPLLGDATYGAHFAASARRLAPDGQSALEMLGRQALHAAVLGFEHPITGKLLRFESPLPERMRQLMTTLGRSGTST